ncbi:MAG TPA: phage portal protein [Bacteroidia bacterium]|nr:phage portal protein [Bacteroidia bacterium]
MKSLVSAFAGAVARALPNNWFLRGDDSPSEGRTTSISRPYSQSACVFSALRIIAQPLRSAAVVWKDDKGALVEDAALSAFWSAPARGVHEPMDFRDLVETTLAVRGVAGGVFWILDDSWLARTAALHNPILVAAPSQMTPVYDGRVLDGWTYRDGSGRMMTLAREQVIHLRYPNPDQPDSLDGVAPWMPVKPSAEAARAGQIYARRTMDQNGDRGKLIIAKYALTPAQKEMVRAELREKRRAAERGEYRDSVLGGDFEVHESPMAAVSADFAKQLEASREEIFVAYGVPPSMAAQTASYSVGAASDWYRLITGTCAAEGGVIAGAMARVAMYHLGWRDLRGEVAGYGSRVTRGNDRRLVAEFDFSGHPVMAEVRASRVDQLEKLFRIGVPVESANEFLSLGLPKYEGWGQRWLPVSYAPVEGQESRVTGHEEKGGGEDVEQLVRDWSRGRRERMRRAQSSARAERWKRVDGARNADRERVRKLVARHLMAARAETLSNLKKTYEAKGFGTASEYQVRSGVIEIVFDLDRWWKGLWNDLGRMLGGIFRSASEQAGEEIEDVADAGSFDPMTEADPAVIEELNRRRNLIKGATDEMHAEVIASLEEGIEAGETLDQLTKRVQAVFNGMSKVRAETIARTETGAAYETARYLTFKKGGITQKGWLSGGDDGHTRATHMAADGQVRGINDFFEVGEARLLHPHDQVNGAKYPQELINCRCVLTAEG